MDNFIHIMEDNNLRPEDIKQVRTIDFAVCNNALGHENQLKTMDDIGWNIGYLIACAAYKYHPARWWDLEVLQDPKVQEFRQRVERVEEHEEGLLGTEVLTRDGKRLMLYGACHGGVCEIKPEGERAPGGMECPEEETTEEVLDKFMNNASRIFPSDKVDKVAQTVLDLGELENVAELMQMVIP